MLGKGLIAFACVCGIVSPANAATFLVTFKGTVQDAQDGLRASFAGDRNVTGDAFELVFTVDDGKGDINESDDGIVANRTVIGYDDENPLSALLRINGIEYSFLTNMLVNGSFGAFGKSIASMEGYQGIGADLAVVGMTFGGNPAQEGLAARVEVFDGSLLADLTLSSPLTFGSIGGSEIGEGFFQIATADEDEDGNPAGPGTFGEGQFAINFVSVSKVGVTNPVPEPATWALMIGGFGIAGGALRRQRRREQAVASLSRARAF